MKTKWNLWSIALCLSMLLSLMAGCGAKEESVVSSGVSNEPPSAVETAPQETAAPDESVQEPEASLEEVTEEPDLTISMPLTEDAVTFTMWHDFVPPLAEFMEGMEDNLAYQTMEEISGVHMEITSISKESAATNVALMVASGDYPNIWDGFAGYYGQSIDTAIEADIIYDLAQYKELLPNYFHTVDSNDTYAKETYTDSGAMGLAYCLNTKQVTESGLLIRKDWLDGLNMDIPVTYDDFTEVLTAMHNTYGGQFWTTYLGDDTIKSISAGFGITAFNLGNETYFEQIDGTVVFSPLESGYLDYVTLMNQWYEAGIIYTDFISGTGTTTCEPDQMGSGQISMVSSPAGFTDPFYAVAADENFELAPVARPVKNAGDEIHQGASVVMTSNNGFSIGTSISDTDENFEILMKWLDYWYTQEGSDLANYGVEGVSYTRNGDGSVQFTELMTNNPDGIAFTLCMNRYVLFVGSFLNDNTRSASTYTEKQQECVDFWSEHSGDGAYVYPTAVSLTTEESDRFNSAYSDIATYVQSETLAFITGNRPLSEYDSFCNTIHSMGIEDLTAIYQDALDRYNAR